MQLKAAKSGRAKMFFYHTYRTNPNKNSSQTITNRTKYKNYQPEIIKLRRSLIEVKSS